MTGVQVLVRNLGRIPYTHGIELQKELAIKYQNANQRRVAGEILFCEHDAVYTFGLRQKEYALEAARLERLGAQVFKVGRGGLTTFHGPGQLVCYPVVNLRQLKLGVREYVRCLELAVIGACAVFSIKAETTSCTGVWVGDQKLCSLGIQVTHGVAFHGLGLNCSNDLSWFGHIVPCGIEGKGVTSLSRLLNKTVYPNEVIPALVESLSRTMKVECVHESQEL
ncbi:hypothetical protein EMCRGX_G029529 [Ephydatia muelleri]